MPGVRSHPCQAAWPYRGEAMRSPRFLCRETLVSRQCLSAVPDYSPSPGLALFIRVRGIPYPGGAAR